jgi:hypothetical protein
MKKHVYTLIALSSLILLSAFASAAPTSGGSVRDVFVPISHDSGNKNKSDDKRDSDVTNAPEIDPASAIGGITLLVAGLTVLRSRKAKI